MLDNVASIRKLIERDRRFTVVEIGEETEVLQCTHHHPIPP